MSKTRILTEDEIKMVERSAGWHSLKSICECLNISDHTLARIRKRQPEVDIAIKYGKFKGIRLAATVLENAMHKGCVKSAIFYLKSKAGWCEAVATQIEQQEPEEIIEIG